MKKILFSISLVVLVNSANGSFFDTALEYTKKIKESNTTKKAVEKSAQIWESTKDKSSNVWDHTKEASKKGWEATKENSDKVYEGAKDLYKDLTK